MALSVDVIQVDLDIPMHERKTLSSQLCFNCSFISSYSWSIMPFAKTGELKKTKNSNNPFLKFIGLSPF